jgi:hypothetical protein
MSTSSQWGHAAFSIVPFSALLWWLLEKASWYFWLLHAFPGAKKRTIWILQQFLKWRELWRSASPGVPAYEEVDRYVHEFAQMIEELLTDELPRREPFGEDYSNTARGRKRRAVHGGTIRSALSVLYKNYAYEFVGPALRGEPPSDSPSAPKSTENLKWFFRVMKGITSCEFKVSQALRLLRQKAGGLGTADSILFENAVERALEIEAE